MIIKISLKRFYVYSWILFWLICNSSFFLIPSINNYFERVNSYHNKLLLTVLAIISFGIYIIFFVNKDMTNLSEIKILIFIFLFWVTMILGWQLIMKGVEVTEALASSYYNYLLVACFLLLTHFIEQKEIERLIRLILIIGTLFAFANIICFIAINYYGIVISDVPIYQIMERNRRLPQGSDFIAFTTILYMSFIKKNKSFIMILGSIICLFELIFVSQVRMILLAIFVSIVVEMYIDSKRKHILIGVFFIAIIYFLLDVLFNNEISIISSFLGEGKRFNSAMYRLVEIKHFVRYIFLNGWFGFGFSKDPTIHIYSITDIGIIGFVSRFGLIGMIWLIFFLKYLLNRFREAQNGASRMLIIFLIMCFISLSPFDAQRITLLPFEILIINSNRYRLKV